MNNFIPLDMQNRGDFEGSGVKVTGDYEDKIFKNGHLVQTNVGHNIVVNSFLILTMLLMKNEADHSGIQYWAVGSGASSWDSSIPNPTVSETALVSEIGRVAINPSDIVFLDSNYEETSTPTNIIKITANFDTGDCNGEWREFGLFGGDATDTADSGYMIDKRNHALITKTSDMTVERTLRLTIQFS